MPLPPVQGRSLRVEFRPSLTEWRGMLLSNRPTGDPVHAASFLRHRLIVLETELLATPRLLRRILVHEVFHFVWARLGNPRRREWEQYLRREMEAGARGELGWSAEMRKLEMKRRDWRNRTRLWREYVCESFCDTGARLCVGRRRDGEFTLSRRHVEARWLLLQTLLSDKLSV